MNEGVYRLYLYNEMTKNETDITIYLHVYNWLATNQLIN